MVRVGVVSAAATTALDVLFLVDNTTNEEQEAALVDAFPSFVAGLSEITTPDLHVGVISSDMGAGDFDLPNCSGEGDAGRLQNQARVTGCTPPSGAYIEGVTDAGELAETFACIAALGINGCGFEQHLASLRRALDGSQPFNVGFLRADAHLLVVILADEDDCSAYDPAAFDPASIDTLGPLSSFRCFELGVDCEVGNEDPRAAGVRDGCHARRDSPYLDDVAEHVDFLRSLKDGPQLMVSAIVGDAVPVEVGTNPENGDPRLVPSCRSDRGIADPAVRLTELTAGFPARGHAYSICADDYDAMLGDIGARAGEAIATGCLDGDLPDDLAGCTVDDVRHLDTADEVRTSIPPCGDAPCFRFETDARCGHNATQTALVVERDASPPAGTVTVVSCPAP